MINNAKDFGDYLALPHAGKMLVQKISEFRFDKTGCSVTVATITENAHESHAIEADKDCDVISDFFEERGFTAERIVRKEDPRSTCVEYILNVFVPV